jgi:hypothetical protein
MMIRRFSSVWRHRSTIESTITSQALRAADVSDARRSGFNESFSIPSPDCRKSLLFPKHLVFRHLYPLPERGPPYPYQKRADRNRSNNSNDDIDHCFATSFCPPSYMLCTYRTSSFRSSSFKRPFHAGISLPGMPCSSTVHALTVVG